MLEVYKINEELNKQLKDMSLSRHSLVQKQAHPVFCPSRSKENCQEESYDMVNKYNTQDNAACVRAQAAVLILSSLSALMLQVKRVADGERDAAELQA